jgi:hypothetical protein
VTEESIKEHLRHCVKCQKWKASMDAQSSAAAAAASTEANKDASMTTLSKILLACAKAISLGEDAIPGLEALADLLGQPAVAAGLGIAAQAGNIVQGTLTALQAKAAS